MCQNYYVNYHTITTTHSTFITITIAENVIPYVVNVCILVLQYTQRYIEIMLLMSLMNCINVSTICCQIDLLLRVALYPICLIVFV